MKLPEITLADIENALARKRRNKFYSYFPDTGTFRRELYNKHVEFFEQGAHFRQRLFLAANRVGKTDTGCYEITCHLTGQYPEWWTGKRFNRPVNILASGETGKLVRDSLQEKLIGPPTDIGSGLIPFDCIIERRMKSGIPDAVDTVKVKHTKGISLLQFQSYDQGRESFQATAREVVYYDEEPPLDIYTEGLTRTMTTGGIVITTFTPLKGRSETVNFLEKQYKEGKIAKVIATWDDAPHLSEADKEEMLSNYPPHQRDARSKGIPSLGSGAIYPVAESEIVCAPFAIPVYWQRAFAMDVGWNKTAALWGAIDRDNDILYIYGEYYRGQAEPSVHSEAIKRQWDRMPGVIDPAARGRGQKDGEQLLKIYQELGLNISVSKNSVEGGIFDVYQRLSTGRLKVFSTCQNFWEEYSGYHRDEKGNVVKENDHLMDCLRYFVLSGLNVADFPPEYRQSLTTKTMGHQITYDPLAPAYVKQDLGISQHQINYDPLKY